MMITLSGGDLGGTQVDGTGWVLGTKKTITVDGKNYIYILAANSQAVFAAMA